MAGEKSVKLSILGDNSQAKAALEEIDVQAEALKEEHPELSIGIDQARAQEQLAIFRQALKDAAKQVSVPVEVDQPQGLTDLQAKIAELDATRATVKIDADDKEASLKLAEFDLALDRIKDKSVDPKISERGIDEAMVKLAALDLEMDRIKEKQGGSSNFLAGIGNGINGALENIPLLGGALQKLSSSISGVDGEAESAGEGLASIGGSAAAVVPALGAVAVAVGGALAELTGLITGLAAAGGGFAAFGAVAYPTIMKVYNALGDSRSQLAKLPEPMQEAVGIIKDIEGEYGNLVKEFQAPVLDVLLDALSAADFLMPYLANMAKAAMGPVENLAYGLAGAIDSKNFAGFMNFLTSLTGPAITAIGSGVKGLVPDFEDLFTILSKKDVINTINIAFRALGFALDTVIFFIRLAMDAWDGWSALFGAYENGARTAARVSEEVAHGIASAFDGVRHALASFGHGFASAFDAVRHALATAGHDVASGFDAIRSTIATVVGDVASFIKIHFQEIEAWIADPIGMAVYTVKSNTHNIAVAFDDMRHNVAATADSIAKTVETAFDDVRHGIATVADWIPHAVETAWDDARHTTAAFADWAPHAVATAFDDVRHGISAAFDAAVNVVRNAWADIRSAFSLGAGNVESTARSIPSRIIGALTALPGDLFNAGRNVIQGLIQGIESEASAIPSIMHQLASDVESYFTDPLKIFSPSRVFMEHGQNIVQGLVNGINGSSHLATAAVTHMANQVASAGAVGIHAGAGSGGAALTAEWIGGSGADAQFISWLKENIRIRGGNPAVLGR